MYWTNKTKKKFLVVNGPVCIVVQQSTQSFRGAWSPQVFAPAPGGNVNLKLGIVSPRVTHSTLPAPRLTPHSSQVATCCQPQAHRMAVEVPCFILLFHCPMTTARLIKKRTKTTKRIGGRRLEKASPPCWALSEIENVFRILMVLSRIQIQFSLTKS